MGVAQPAEKHERRRQRQRVSDETAPGGAFANILDDPFGLGPEAAPPFATAPASQSRQGWTAASGSGWPTGDSSAWPATAAVAQPPAVPSRAVTASEPTIQVNGAPVSARRRNAPRFDDAILDALQDLPSDTLAAMLRRLAQQRPAEFSEAFSQRAPTAGTRLSTGSATSTKSPWSAGATAADPPSMGRQNSGLDSWPATKPGSSPLPQRATPLSSPALPAASARALGSSPPSQTLTPSWDHPTASPPAEAMGSPPSASASPMVQQASTRSASGPEWPASNSTPGASPATTGVTRPVPSSPAMPQAASSASRVPPSTTGAVSSWPVPNSPAMAVAAAAAAAAPSGGMGPGVAAEPAAVPDPWGGAAATPENAVVTSPWPEAAAPAPDFAWPVAGDAWPAQAG